ncbi:MAG: TonB-dependent receptor [Alphaproteobacteria bacterium]|nr:TonB-dependent receptor [Alphaproteobacteria bacterium]
MKKSGLLGTTAVASVTFIGLTFGAVAPAHAQDATAQATAVDAQTADTNNNGIAADDSGTTEAIVVTGSRIRRPALESAVPVTSMTADELLSTGSVSIGDQLNNLPSLASTFSQANSTRFIGTTGLNLLNLRDLGTSRTLVLVNGRRHITSSEGEFSVDVNTIPVDLIDRVDVVTGGSSAVYGSDAIAGVVNFITKRDFQGISVKGQGGVSTHGDAGSYFGSITAGQNFADGRGNIAVSAEYAQNNALYYTDRPEFTGAFTGRRQFQLTSPVNNDGTPDRTFVNGGVYSLGSSDGGTFIAYNGSTTNRCLTGSVACKPGTTLSRIFRFDPNGNLSEANYGTDLRGIGSGNGIGAVGGSTLNNTGQLEPGLKRYSVNLLAHYDVSDAFRPYIEAKYVRVDSVQESSPTFASGGAQGATAAATYASNSTGIPIQLDNPFLNPAARATITSLLAPGSTFFRLQRNNLDLGSRGEFAKRETFRVVGGVEGTFNDDWHYDVSLNYGHFSNYLLSQNNRIESRFRNAVDATRNSAGQIVCRINADASTANDDAACVPVNLLGQGNPSQAALNYFMADTTYHGKATELDATASVSGDLSQLFSLPGGPIKFALGGEYRRETASYAFDDLVSSGQTFLNAIAPFNPPSFAVKEAFGEIEIPILRDFPFAQELTLQGAGRVSDYKGAVGTVFAYNGGVVYAPIRDIRFRANYSRSVRSPTLGDLYSSPSQNFALIDDPCDANFSTNGTNNGANRQANCRSIGLDPTTFVNSPARAATVSYLSGGNPNLKAETSDSYTVGVVIQPRWISGLAITADYYDIKVKNVIAAISAQQIVDSCYDSSTLDNQYCKLVNPRDASGFFASPALLQSSVNFAGLRAKGLDVDVSYNHKFSTDLAAQLHFVGTWVRTRNDFPYFDTPTLPERIKSELGDPAYAFNVSADVKYKNVNLGYQLRYIGKQTVTDYEATHDSPQGPAYDPDYSDPAWYPTVWYHDVRLGIEVDKNYNFYLGVDNLLNKMPPLGLLGNGGGDAIYSNTGRFVYAGFKAKF